MKKQEMIKSKEYQLEIARKVDELVELCHGLAVESGWWSDPETGERTERNDGELISLMHSELSEALEGIRKDLPDKHLPDYRNVTVEMGDALVRILDYCGGRRLMVGCAMAEKLAYNTRRADHKASERTKENGKKF